MYFSNVHTDFTFKILKQILYLKQKSNYKLKQERLIELWNSSIKKSPNIILKIFIKLFLLLLMCEKKERKFEQFWSNKSACWLRRILCGVYQQQQKSENLECQDSFLEYF